jgi:hypothetical protein
MKKAIVVNHYAPYYHEFLNRNQTQFASNQYLHGEAESLAGFDQFYWEGDQPSKGVHIIEVHYDKGHGAQTLTCLAFIWKTHAAHETGYTGLVCLESDQESIDYAMRQMLSRTPDI